MNYGSYHHRGLSENRVFLNPLITIVDHHHHHHHHHLHHRDTQLCLKTELIIIIPFWNGQLSWGYCTSPISDTASQLIRRLGRCLAGSLTSGGVLGEGVLLGILDRPPGIPEGMAKQLKNRPWILSELFSQLKKKTMTWIDLNQIFLDCHSVIDDAPKERGFLIGEYSIYIYMYNCITYNVWIQGFVTKWLKWGINPGVAFLMVSTITSQ